MERSGNVLKRILYCATFIMTLCGAGAAAAEAPDCSAYLFTYFTGNAPGQEAIHYAISDDGFHFRALNNNNPIVNTETISTSGGVRDPHILRGADSTTFYMVVTDLYVHKMGWKNYAMVLMKSTDLIHWESSIVNIPESFPNQFGDVYRVWAPQTIYDETNGKYMVYFSMKQGDDPDKIYYAYANPDFTGLETVPEQLFFSETDNACIDGDIVSINGKFHLFFKSEDGQPGIKLALSDHLTKDYIQISSERVDRSNFGVEGSGIFKLNDREEWILMYDVYRKHQYQFTQSSDLRNFEIIDQETSMNFKPRHGSVLSITAAEKNRLLAEWGVLTTRKNMLNGLYADPDILYAEKTGKYYLYPTSDGFENWAGTYFKTFSSENLVHWKEEGIILDLKTDVNWESNNAWAPCIIEKKIDQNYRYFYYFSAGKKIGVAVADHPTGPFKDSGKALIDALPEGVRGGQQIDPDVFCDPQTGKNYLYWGSGYMVGAVLNDDMVSIKEDTLTVMTPDSTYREGTYVFFRNGLYYFQWSENDTRSEDYRVRYATATSPLGKLTIPKDNLVIAKDPARGIYGTGHNSVIQIPGKDEWYIVYHRFCYPDGITMGRSAGYNREICIDRMTFDDSGNILQVNPTHKGIAPVE